MDDDTKPELKAFPVFPSQRGDMVDDAAKTEEANLTGRTFLDKSPFALDEQEPGVSQSTIPELPAFKVPSIAPLKMDHPMLEWGKYEDTASGAVNPMMEEAIADHTFEQRFEANWIDQNIREMAEAGETVETDMGTFLYDPAEYDAAAQTREALPIFQPEHKQTTPRPRQRMSMLTKVRFVRRAHKSLPPPMVGAQPVHRPQEPYFPDHSIAEDEPTSPNTGDYGAMERLNESGVEYMRPYTQGELDIISTNVTILGVVLGAVLGGLGQLFWSTGLMLFIILPIGFGSLFYAIGRMFPGPCESLLNLMGLQVRYDV